MYPIYIDSLAVFSAYIFRWNRGGERGRERERRAIHRVDSFILVFFSSHPQDKRRGGEGRPSYLLVVNGRRDESFRIAIRCLVPSLALRLNYMKIEHASRERERERILSIDRDCTDSRQDYRASTARVVAPRTAERKQREQEGREGRGGEREKRDRLLVLEFFVPSRQKRKTKTIFLDSTIDNDRSTDRLLEEA